MLFLFSITLFLSACMLFVMELLYAKMVLPLLGGTPAVWNTCSVFFQMALLAGYSYAHFSASKLKPRTQVILHIALLVIPLALLPIVLPLGWQPPRGGNPVWWLLMLMTVTVGLPFVVVSTSAPLIQRWFTYTDHPAGEDPYFLYAASNAGSFVGLIGYLAFLEPNLNIAKQNIIWKYGYVVLVILIAACGYEVWKGVRNTDNSPKTPPQNVSETKEVSKAKNPLPTLRKLRWLMLAFIPSSLMLGVTTHLTTDIASVPLLWVVPLALYLLSFVIAFARREYIPQQWLIKLLPALVLFQTVGLAKANVDLMWLILIPMPTFLILAIACHRELVIDRPSAKHLTEFYLLMSVGGMLGGMFNALLAPQIFKSILEYPIMLVLACVALLLPRPGVSKEEKEAALKVTYMDSVWIAAISAFLIGTLSYALTHGYSYNSIFVSLALGITGIACYFLINKPIRFGITLGLLLTIIECSLVTSGQTIFQERSFFGVARVRYNAYTNMNELIHGTTLHGMQSRDPVYRYTALTYYFQTGPLGQAFQVFSGANAKKDVAVVGLGTGSLAAFAQKGQRYTFYEIDKSIEDIALNPNYFSYIYDARARGADVNIVLGDARLSIADAPDKSYDMIIMDAFSSDSVPMHLITKQALALYLTKLKEHGIVVFHLSNRYLDLVPVFSNLVVDSGMQGIIRGDSDITMDEKMKGKVASCWLLVARNSDDFLDLAKDNRWVTTMHYPDKPVWTDDYTNIYSVLRWKR
ncbi:MAG: spermidine synthase [Armatimonadota bacterium]